LKLQQWCNVTDGKAEVNFRVKNNIHPFTRKSLVSNVCDMTLQHARHCVIIPSNIPPQGQFTTFHNNL